jgi:hypothetical protein
VARDWQGKPCQSYGFRVPERRVAVGAGFDALFVDGKLQIANCKLQIGN